MCLIALAVGAHPRYPLVIASNRDEFFERPAAPLSEWRTATGHTVWAGRDLRDGGTWLGFAPSGRFAMLTNVREGSAAPSATSGLRSRGELVLQWLEGSSDAETFNAQLDTAAYAGFNLVVGRTAANAAPPTCFYITNRPIAQAKRAQAAIKNIATGSIVGLSNASLDTPWPKTQALTAALRNGLQQAPNEQTLRNTMLVKLRDTTQCTDADLPQTGVPLELERTLSSAFVSRSDAVGKKIYGTRCSTFVLWSQIGLAIQEWTYPAQADAPVNQASLVTLHKHWPSAS